MSLLGIFIVGAFVTLLTFVAAALVGFSEAADPTLSRVEELTNIEKAVVQRGTGSSAR